MDNVPVVVVHVVVLKVAVDLHQEMIGGDRLIQKEEGDLTEVETKIDKGKQIIFKSTSKSIAEINHFY